MITFGSGVLYIEEDGEMREVGKVLDCYATTPSKVLPKHFKSVKLNNKELVRGHKDS